MNEDSVREEEQEEEPVGLLTEEEISRSYGQRTYNSELSEGFILDCA